MRERKTLATAEEKQPNGQWCLDLRAGLMKCNITRQIAQSPELYLNKNLIGDAGATALASALQVTPVMRELFMWP